MTQSQLENASSDVQSIMLNKLNPEEAAALFTASKTLSQKFDSEKFWLEKTEAFCQKEYPSAKERCLKLWSEIKKQEKQIKSLPDDVFVGIEKLKKAGKEWVPEPDILFGRRFCHDTYEYPRKDVVGKGFMLEYDFLNFELEKKLNQLFQLKKSSKFRIKVRPNRNHLVVSNEFGGNHLYWNASTEIMTIQPHNYHYHGISFEVNKNLIFSVKDDEKKGITPEEIVAEKKKFKDLMAGNFFHPIFKALNS